MGYVIGSQFKTKRRKSLRCLVLSHSFTNAPCCGSVVISRTALCNGGRVSHLLFAVFQSASANASTSSPAARSLCCVNTSAKADSLSPESFLGDPLGDPLGLLP